jgi:feruloyl esterase
MRRRRSEAAAHRVGSAAAAAWRRPFVARSILVSLLALIAACGNDHEVAAPTVSAPPSPSVTATVPPATATRMLLPNSPTPRATVSPTASPSPSATAAPSETPIPSPTSMPGMAACAALTGYSSEGVFRPSTTIAAAVFHAASASLPEHCEIIGHINPRTGLDGQSYVIKYRLRLPTTWNDRFYFQGGGGLDGFFGDSIAGSALPLGYAVVSTDSGHDNAVNTDNANGGIAAFARDPQARIDFGYNALDLVTRAAKALIGVYFGHPPLRSYFVGCSNGGRQGMVAAQRFPDAFDGIVAGAPGFNLPRAAVAEAWNEQALATLATRTDINGAPYLPDAFSTADLQLVANAILEACDGLDDLRDGIVDNFPACSDALVMAQLMPLVCRGAKTESCLHAAQVQALRRIMNGASDSRGTRLYASFPWDAGIVGPTAFTMWSLGGQGAPGQPLLNSAFNLTLGAAALSALFSTPPVALPVSGLAQFMFDYDFDVDAPAIDATSGAFTESAMQFMAANSADRSAFRAHGGKLIIYHGTSDGVFSINDTISWYDAVDTATGSQASEFIRLFAVPGLGHCFLGPSTSEFDAFGPMVDWVENGVAPDRLVATAPAGSPWPGRTRPLCPYPQQARYSGSGRIEDAANFVCQDGF